MYMGRHSEQRKSKEKERQRGANATGRRWGVMHQDRRKSGVKKRWLEFVVWMKIGMVRLGRKMGF